MNKEYANKILLRVGENDKIHFSTEQLLKFKNIPTDIQPAFGRSESDRLMKYGYDFIAGPGKPVGLWYANASDWYGWLSSEMIHYLRTYKSVYKIDINVNAVLSLKSTADVIAFTKLYGYFPKYRERVYKRYKFLNTPDERLKAYDIDWKKVSENFSAIEITPYQHILRHKLLWYYTWDVASGCIWNKKAIRKIQKIG